MPTVRARMSRPAWQYKLKMIFALAQTNTHIIKVENNRNDAPDEKNKAFSTAPTYPIFLYVEAKVHDVAVLDDVILALEAHFAL